jgi:hypothetical protein
MPGVVTVQKVQPVPDIGDDTIDVKHGHGHLASLWGGVHWRSLGQ